jgi:hypothetical protein
MVVTVYVSTRTIGYVPVPAYPSGVKFFIVSNISRSFLTYRYAYVYRYPYLHIRNYDITDMFMFQDPFKALAYTRAILQRMGPPRNSASWKSL